MLMAKYRKKPVVIEAEQFRGGHMASGWPDCICRCEAIEPNSDGVGWPHVHTMEGPLKVSEGDWIITGVKGEKYPCKPDIFAMTYEPVIP